MRKRLLAFVSEVFFLLIAMVLAGYVWAASAESYRASGLTTKTCALVVLGLWTTKAVMWRRN